MKKTAHYKGHRWTNDEIRNLMGLWAAGTLPEDIAAALKVSIPAVLKMSQKLRKNGIPLEKRNSGSGAHRHYKLWTQGEIEFMLRKREEKATDQEIAISLGRSLQGVQGMVQNLRRQGVPVAMRGHGVRRLWDVDAVKAVAIQSPESKIIELNQSVA